MRVGEERFSAIVEQIYEAGLGRLDWSDVIADISAAVGRGQACLEYVNYATGEGRILGLVGYGADSIEQHYPLFLEHDPWAHRLPWDYAGEHSLGTEILSERERVSTFFVNELCPIVGLETKDILATFLARNCDRRGAKAAVGALMIYSGENQPSFGQDEVNLLRQIRPHLVKALELQARLETASALNACKQAALDGLTSGLWLLDRGGRILYANAKALALQQGRAFDVRGIELHFRDPDADRDLHTAIACAAPDAAFAKDANDGAFLVYSPDFARPLSVIVTPASAVAIAALFASVDAFPAVAVSVADAAPNLDAKLRTMQGLFALTEAEIRVLGDFMVKSSLQAIAQDAGVSVYTVRTQLKSIMEKTATHSQRELSSLVLAGIP